MPARALPQTLHEIADGVFFWWQPGGETGVSNAGVIVEDDGLTVVDTLMVRSQWEPFARAVGALGRPVRRVVLTHAHVDHVGGTSCFPGAEVHASTAAIDQFALPFPADAYRAFMPAFADELDDLGALGPPHVDVAVDAPAPVGARAALRPMPGHTGGDLVVDVADASLTFAGDLCFFGVTPLAFQGDPVAWCASLEELADRGATLVPGHGPVGGEGEVRELVAYLRACIDARGDPGAIPGGPWDAWPERDPRDAINVERADRLARGDDGFPVAMLRALGLA